ncbi:hypothetical protein ACUIAK_10860 [Bacillus cytotoxicus]|uniref:Uncharacterized protein n=1 Tax=Bacillus cytotoxicus TaxID=580165 RepID=A0AAX2CIH2_9BACI|nr:Uncharacterized protein BCB44BAC_02715 [Bacillus cytotoxicus]
MVFVKWEIIARNVRSWDLEIGMELKIGMRPELLGKHGLGSLS